jgi:uncharacterized OB-fold protein
VTVPDVALPPPVPFPTPATQPYWDGLARDELLMPRCRTCASWVFYPRRRCTTCLSEDLAWERVAPEATIHTFTRTHRPTAPVFADAMPQVIAVVELANGVRMTTTIETDDPAALRVGTSVVGVFDHAADRPTLLRFRTV